MNARISPSNARAKIAEALSIEGFPDAISVLYARRYSNEFVRRYFAYIKDKDFSCYEIVTLILDLVAKSGRKIS